MTVWYKQNHYFPKGIVSVQFCKGEAISSGFRNVIQSKFTQILKVQGKFIGISFNISNAIIMENFQR